MPDPSPSQERDRPKRQRRALLRNAGRWLWISAVVLALVLLITYLLLST